MTGAMYQLNTYSSLARFFFSWEYFTHSREYSRSEPTQSLFGLYRLIFFIVPTYIHTQYTYRVVVSVGGNYADFWLFINFQAFCFSFVNSIIKKKTTISLCNKITSFFKLKTGLQNRGIIDNQVSWCPRYSGIPW